jgi:hypothetical protein
MVSSFEHTANPGDEEEEHSTPASYGKRKKGVEAIRSVNLHQLGENFVEKRNTLTPIRIL